MLLTKELPGRFALAEECVANSGPFSVPWSGAEFQKLLVLSTIYGGGRRGSLERARDEVRLGNSAKSGNVGNGEARSG